MSARVPATAWLRVLPALALLSGCAVQRIDDGVYHSPKGYRVAIPGAQWVPLVEGPADLELRHRTSTAAMAANAVCEAAVVKRPAAALARQLLIGVRERTVIEQGEIQVAGRPAVHTVVDGRLVDSEDRVRIETLVTKDDRCVYDLMYAAPEAAFAELRLDFSRFVDSFQTE